MEKVTVTKVFTDKQETQYGAKTRTTIFTREYPDVRMSSLQGGLRIKEGDTVEVEITKNGNFTNFKVAGVGGSSGGKGFAALAKLEARIVALEKAVFSADVDAGSPQSDGAEDVAGDVF